MPYIDQTDRDQIDPELDALGRTLEQYDVGELNYAITTLCDRFAVRNGSISYAESINDVIGVLECVKLEFYRRPAASHEDRKLVQNGEVYPKLQTQLLRGGTGVRHRD